MEKLTKENLKLMASSASLESMIELMKNRMFWNVINVTPSVNYSFGRKQVYDIETSKGVNNNTIIVCEKSRCKLYMIFI